MVKEQLLKLRLRKLETEIAEAKKRLPAHSAKPPRKILNDSIPVAAERIVSDLK